MNFPSLLNTIFGQSQFAVTSYNIELCLTLFTSICNAWQHPECYWWMNDYYGIFIYNKSCLVTE